MIVTRRLTRRGFHIGVGGLLIRPALAFAQQNPPADRSVRLPPHPTPGTSRRLAFVMGNNAYIKAPALRNSVHDAEDMSSKLAALGFDVTKQVDAKAATARAALSAFTSTLQTGDIALFFYSGHGVQAQGENYMIPVDFDPAGGESALDANCLKATAARDGMERSGAQLNVVILDACRSNPFHPNTPVKGMALMEPGLGTCIALATGPGLTASDNPSERNGLFTKRLLEQLGRPGEDLDSLFKKVKDQVFEDSGGKQRPWVFSDLVGEFYFTPPQARPTPAPQAAPASHFLEEGAQQFQTGRFAEAAASFERAVQIDPENAYAYNALGSARARLKQWSLALGQFNRAIAIKADYGAAYFNRGVAYYNSGVHDDLALQDFSWAIDREPYDPLALDMRGRTYLKLRDNDNALADFNHASELDPSNAMAMAGRGSVYYRLGRFKEAVKELTDSIALRPEASAYDSRSQAFRALHQSAEADADARHAEQLRNRQ